MGERQPCDQFKPCGYPSCKACTRCGLDHFAHIKAKRKQVRND